MGLAKGSLVLPRLGGRPSKARMRWWAHWRGVTVVVLAIVTMLSLPSGHVLRLPSGSGAPEDHPVQATALIHPASSRGCVTDCALARSGDYPAPLGIACIAIKHPNGTSGRSSTWPPKPARHVIHLMAFRRWAAEESAKGKTAGCGDNGLRRGGLRLDAAFRYSQISGDDLSRPLETATMPGLGDWNSDRTLNRDAALACEPTASQATFKPSVAEPCCAASVASGGEVGSGDRASLPGRSTRYRVIWLTCAQCGAAMACLFYDDGDMPLCVNPLHGPMEVSR
jgi:hypothetical protein